MRKSFFHSILLVAAISGIAAPDVIAQDVKADSAGILVGAIRWDWTGGGSVNEAVERSLGPKQWHYRLPFFGRIINDSTVEASCASQECMDREILYAKENGLDYWAFLLYPEGSDLDLPLRNYLSSGYNPLLNFCVIGDKPVDRVVEYFKHPSYQTVLGNRPLYYILFGETEEGHVAALRAACAAEGIPDPYVVHMKEAKDADEDAIGRYWYNGTQFGGELDGAAYSVLAAAAASDWEERFDKAYEQVPLVSAGTDGRPRIENTPPWVDDPGFYAYYFEQASPEELASSLQDAVNFVDAHPENCPSRAILMYSWNENDEGGWLMPTLDTLNPDKIDDSRLRAIKEVVAPTNSTLPSSRDAALHTILVNGDTVPGFHPDTMNYTLHIPSGSPDPPVITAITRSHYARVQISVSDALHYASITVQSEDGSFEREYFLQYSLSYIPRPSINWEFNEAGNTDGWMNRWSGHAAISAPDSVLRIEVLGDYPEILSPAALGINAVTYDRLDIRMKNNTSSDDWYLRIPLPDGESAYIDFTPSTMDEDFKDYSVDLGVAPEWEGRIDQFGLLVARLVRTGSVDIDYIRLKLTDETLSEDASLANISVNGQMLDGFDADILAYTYALPPGSSEIPVVEASGSHPGASVLISQAEKIGGRAIISVIAQNGLENRSYTIDFGQTQIQRVQEYFRDFREPHLPSGWPDSPEGYRARVNDGTFRLDINKTSRDQAYVLGSLYVESFDLRPYMTIRYACDDSLDISMILYGPDNAVSDTGHFFLPAAGEWLSYTFNISMLASSSWGYHLDSIQLEFMPGAAQFQGEFLLDQILIGEEAMGKTFSLELHQGEALEVDLGRDTSIHFGDLFFLDAGLARSYLWNTGDTLQTLRVDSTGIYSVQISDARNCTAVDSIEITLLAGMEDAQTVPETGFRLFPNPARDFCWLEISPDLHSQPAFLSISDLSGRVCLRKSPDQWPVENALQIDLSKLPAGVYLLSLETDQGRFSCRLSILE